MDAAVFADDLGFIEGPVWDSAAGTLSVVSIDRGCVYTLDGDDARCSSVRTGGGPNGMVLSNDGLLVAQNGGIFGASGPAEPGVQRIAHGEVGYAVRGRFTAPNDLAFGPDGWLYVTDPMTDAAVFEPIAGRVFACDPATGEHRIVIEDRLCPNGLAFTSAGGHLMLAQTQPRLVERFAVQDDRLVSEGKFCDLRNGRPDGMAFDTAGRLWICTPGTGGVEVFAADGDFVERIELGEGSMTTNLCFGGADRCSVFVTAAGWGKILTFRSDIPGLELSTGPSGASSGSGGR